MAARIAAQHTKINELIEQLQEAVITRAKLAGLQQELEIARHVQMAILPQAPPQLPELDLDGRMVPAKEVGGDFYDYFTIDAERIGIVVADVSGKGVPAALFMAITRTLLKATALFIPSPAACVERLNNLLAAENEQMMFVTLIYGVIEPRTGRFTYTNAGHNHPYRIDATGGLAPLPATGGMAAAVMEDVAYREATLQLEPGDTIFLFTDGVTEAIDSEDREFGTASLEAVLGREAAGSAVREVGEKVIEAVRVFAGDAPQADDITCVTLRFHGCSGRLPVSRRRAA
jgi:sigma-B regulation protein RsbU (phosphoserine phosphatase)